MALMKQLINWKNLTPLQRGWIFAELRSIADDRDYGPPPEDDATFRQWRAAWRAAIGLLVAAQAPAPKVKALRSSTGKRKR